MGVKLQHILGIFLIFQICSVHGGSASSESADTEKNDTTVNLIKKLPKTNAELNTVDQEITKENVKDSLEHPKTSQPTQSTEPNTRSEAVGREDNKENAITQEFNSDGEDKAARAIDIQKFISTKFQNVYSYPVSSGDYPKFELTTPKSRHFDQKYEEARQKLEQEYEENAHDNNSHDDEEEDEHRGFESHEDDHMDKTLEDLAPEPNSTLDYKEQINISKDNVIEKNSNQNSLTIEQVKKVHFVSNYNDTSTFKYDSKEATTSAKPLFHPTEKTATLTKPTAIKNNHILSNKIESETIKAILSEATTEKLRLVEPKQQTTTEGTTTVRETTTADVGTTTVAAETTTTSVDEITTEGLTVPTTEEESSTTTTEATTIQETSTTSSEISTTTNEPTTTEPAGVPITTIEVAQSTEPIDITTELATTTTIITTTSTIAATTETTTEQQLTTNEKMVPTNPLPETTVEFIHVETRNNHTTLVPDTLSPNLSYPTTTNDSAAANDTQQRSLPEHTTSVGTTEDSSETAESSASTDGTTMGNPDESNGKVIAIVISSVGAVCLILLAGLLYVMRKRQNRFNYKQRCRPVNLDDYSVDNISVYNSVRRKADRQSKRSYGNPAFDDPVAVTHPLNFPALAKFAANVDDIRAEFEEIPQISAKTSELPPGCETKNRYANVIPLPETRVHLRPIDGYPTSDYINANFVTGPKNTRGYYIATQAPMEDTVDDFWRMIWEQQSKVILMITHLFENGVEKSVDYLPPSEVLDCHRLFGDYQVTLKKRDVKEKYVISSLQLKNMVSNSWREITHFWYLGWPEKGVPSEGNSLIAFLIEARSFMKSSTLDKNYATNGNTHGPSGTSEVNPVVVHCSPGTGRTGVVIACDIAIREFEQTRLVDIPRIVYRIRRDRASAVQTKEQYNFIYKVISLYATKLTGGSLDTF